MALDDCLDLRRAFGRADAEFRAGIDRLLPIGEPGNESGRVIGDTALYQLAELAKVRRKAWDADCVKAAGSDRPIREDPP
jgi:hypothetical protein